MVGEVQAQAAQQHRFAGADGREVDVGRVGGRDMAQAVPFGVGGVTAVGGVGGHREVALGEDHGGQAGQHPAVVQGEHLAAVGPVVEPDRAGRVRPHPHGVRRRPYGPREHPLQVAAVARTGRILVRAQLPVRPLVQARAGPDGARAVHAVIGEQGHLRGHRVHQQLRRLRRAPDPAGPRRRGVDDMDRQPCAGREQAGRGGAEAFQDAGAARSGTDEGDGGGGGGDGGDGGGHGGGRRRAEGRRFRVR